MAEDSPGVYIPDKRVTAPQQAYTTEDVSWGFAVLVVGVLITFGIPLLLG